MSSIEMQGPADLSPGAVQPRPLEPLFSGSAKSTFIVGFLIWWASFIYFWMWWLQPDHIQSWAMYWLATFILAWVTITPVYFMLLFYRAKVIPADREWLQPPPRIALVVTKAPSEPLEVVAKTLTAMMAQVGHPFDVWLADEDPSTETRVWCDKRGIKISTRKNVEAYHQTAWPRRTRCKEGNLAYFYDMYGYELYDFVLQFDADHVPEKTYLQEVMKGFADSRVGYVSAPSICDANAQTSWSARGRLYAEASMHGSLQVGYNDDWAPLCIGSHYAVRTAALKQAGGLGPELAEDHSTTLLMNAAGWRGVHAINAIAHGDGPQTFADMVVQEFQWSRSLTTILLQYLPRYYAQLPGKLKFQFLFAQLWYPLFSVAMAVMFAMPLVAILAGRNYAIVTYYDFLIHFTPISLSLIFFSFFWRRTMSYRPFDAKVFSWENILYVFARWPWSLIGCLSSCKDKVTGKFVDFKITPKGTKQTDHVPARVLYPYVALALASAGVAAFFPTTEAAHGFYVFAIMNALIYSLLALMIFIFHVMENKVRSLPRLPSLWLAILGIVLSFVIGAYAIPNHGRLGLVALTKGTQIEASVARHLGVDLQQLTYAVGTPPRFWLWR